MSETLVARAELYAIALKEYRSLTESSQEEMSRYFSVSLSTYRNWETLRSVPTKNNIKKINKLLSKFIDSPRPVKPGG